MSLREDDKYGFIDLNKQIIILPQFDWVNKFSEGFYSIRNDNKENGIEKYEFISTEGKKVFKKEFDYASKFEDGKAKYRNRK